MTVSHNLIPPLARSRARAMRREPTEAEAALWRLPRDRRLSATKWRRRFPLGLFIVDFVCLQRRVIVECEGARHAENPRDAWLRSQGFVVARFWNHEIPRQRASVIDTILARCGLPW